VGDDEDGIGTEVVPGLGKTAHPPLSKTDKITTNIVVIKALFNIYNLLSIILDYYVAYLDY